MTPPPLPAPRLTIAGDDVDRGHWYASDQMLQYAKDYHAAMLGPRLKEKDIVAMYQKWDATPGASHADLMYLVERRVRGEEA